MLDIGGREGEIWAGAGLSLEDHSFWSERRRRRRLADFIRTSELNWHSSSATR